MIDPTTMLAITAGSITTAGGALLALLVLASKIRKLKAEARLRLHEVKAWAPAFDRTPNCRCVEVKALPKQERIPAGQPGAGRFIKAS